MEVTERRRKAAEEQEKEQRQAAVAIQAATRARCVHHIMEHAHVAMFAWVPPVTCADLVTEAAAVVLPLRLRLRL